MIEAAARGWQGCLCQDEGDFQKKKKKGVAWVDWKEREGRVIGLVGAWGVG